MLVRYLPRNVYFRHFFNLPEKSVILVSYCFGLAFVATGPKSIQTSCELTVTPTITAYRCLVAILLLASACNETVVKESTAEKAEESKDAQVAATDGTIQNDPTAVPPVMVGGSYLTIKCAEEMSPTDSKFEALVGCRLEDDKGLRHPAASLAEIYDFGWNAESASGMKVAMRKLADDTRYDAVWYFHSSSLSSLKESMKAIRIIFSVGSMDAPEQMTTASLPEATVPVSSIPEASSTDYQTIGSELSTQIKGGEPTPPIPLR